MTNRNEVLRAAKQAGGIFNGSDWKFYCGFEDDELERFYAIAFKAGMERAAEIADSIEDDLWAKYKGRPPHDGDSAEQGTKYTEGKSDGAGDCAEAIRAHAQNQPESIHDTGNVSKN